MPQILVPCKGCDLSVACLLVSLTDGNENSWCKRDLYGHRYLLDTYSNSKLLSKMTEKVMVPNQKTTRRQKPGSQSSQAIPIHCKQRNTVLLQKLRTAPVCVSILQRPPENCALMLVSSSFSFSCFAFVCMCVCQPMLNRMNLLRATKCENVNSSRYNTWLGPKLLLSWNFIETERLDALTLLPELSSKETWKAVNNSLSTPGNVLQMKRL